MSLHKQKIEAMFNGIAARYDLLNHLLSMGIDKRWRRKLVRRAVQYSPDMALDLATGTADLAIMMAKAGIPHITGVDIAQKMLERAERKIQKQKVHSRICIQVADGEHLPFADNSFDMVTVAFGIRNYENRRAGFAEALRVLRPQGRFLMLEFSMPKNFAVACAYRFYFFRILPLIGRIVSRHGSAYTYLPQSVGGFPSPAGIAEELLETGYAQVELRPMSGGIAYLYDAQK